MLPQDGLLGHQFRNRLVIQCSIIRALYKVACLYLAFDGFVGCSLVANTRQFLFHFLFAHVGWMDRDLELIEVGYLEFGLDVDRYFHRGCAVGADYVSIDLQYGIYPYVIPFHDGIVGVRGDSAL